jgi:hypothetical protein
MPILWTPTSPHLAGSCCCLYLYSLFPVFKHLHSPSFLPLPSYDTPVHTLWPVKIPQELPTESEYKVYTLSLLAWPILQLLHSLTLQKSTNSMIKNMNTSITEKQQATCSTLTDQINDSLYSHLISKSCWYLCNVKHKLEDTQNCLNSMPLVMQKVADKTKEICPSVNSASRVISPPNPHLFLNF